MGLKLSSHLNLIETRLSDGSLNLNDLNEDVMIPIFSYFSLEELLILSQVCLKWKTTINRIFILQKCLQFTPVIGLPFEECCQTNHQLLDKKQSLIRITSNRIEQYKSFVAGLMCQCLNLKSINFVGLDFNDSCSPFRLLIDYCDSDLIHCNFAHLHNKRNFSDKRILIESEETKQFVEKFPNILHFNTYRSWFRFTEQSLSNLISGLNKLEFIGFAKETDCTESDSSESISGDYFLHINPEIQVIRVTKKILGQNGLYYLTKRVKNLRELCIDVIDSIDVLNLICKHFKSLRCLSFCFKIRADDKFRAFRLLSTLDELEEIDIVMSDESEENEITSDSCLLELMSRTPNMKRITFRARITQTSIQFMDQYWPKLEKLLIKWKNSGVISSAIIGVIAKLKNLNYLDLSDCDITDEDVAKMIYASNRLKFVDLSGTRITNKTIDLLIERANSMPNQEFEINLRRTSVSYLSESNRQLPQNLLTH